jgi:broad specificity phosphatase PhoE
MPALSPSGSRDLCHQGSPTDDLIRIFPAFERDLRVLPQQWWIDQVDGCVGVKEWCRWVSGLSERVIVVVTHASVLKLMRRHVSGAQSPLDRDMAPADVVQMRMDGDGVLHSLEPTRLESSFSDELDSIGAME